MENSQTSSPYGEDRPRYDRVQVSPELLERVQTLYDAGLYKQAYDLAGTAGPISAWRGVDARILAGRIAGNLGAPRLGYRHHVRALRESPQHRNPNAYYVEVVL